MTLITTTELAIYGAPISLNHVDTTTKYVVSDITTVKMEWKGIFAKWQISYGMKEEEREKSICLDLH